MSMERKNEFIEQATDKEVYNKCLPIKLQLHFLSSLP
jgi:hypothetical protein